ncbi:MAG TPA: hypothetical protein VKZ98_07030, partial [Aquaticitalea sp.]|nr:hypothetical protein [Aquaticitalea sp.]
MKTKIFWDWFNTNEPYIRKAVDERHSNASLRIFTDFFLVMEAYHPGISYLVETHPRRPDLYRMTLSAHGERSLFMPIK